MFRCRTTIGLSFGLSTTMTAARYQLGQARVPPQQLARQESMKKLQEKQKEHAKYPREIAALLDELDALTCEPIPIGLAFQGLSKESRQFLAKKKIAIEPFLKKFPKKFTISRNDKNTILVSNADFTNRVIDSYRGFMDEKTFGTLGKDGTWENLETDIKRIAYLEARNRVTLLERAQAAQSVAVAADKHKEWLQKEEERKANLRKRRTEKIYEMLKYIPNEWSMWTDLGVPAKVKDAIFEEWRPRRWFDQSLMRHYFETRGENVHQWEIRRSAALQKHMAVLEDAAARGEQGPGTFEEELHKKGYNLD